MSEPRPCASGDLSGSQVAFRWIVGAVAEGGHAQVQTVNDEVLDRIGGRTSTVSVSEAQRGH